jgi:hypothetical protein
VRVKRLPKRYGWAQVIELLDLPSSTSDQVVAAAAEAARRALTEARSVTSLARCYGLFLQLTDGARRDGLVPTLARLGVEGVGGASAAAVIAAIDRRATELVESDGRGGALDAISLATFRAVFLESIAGQSISLFGSTAETVEKALRDLGKTKTVAHLGRQFFSEFTWRALDYALARQTLITAGTGGPLDSDQARTAFQTRLRSYCWDLSKIVEDYSGGWYSKHAWQQALDVEDVRKFTQYALTKLLSELPAVAN